MDVVVEVSFSISATVWVCESVYGYIRFDQRIL